MQIKTSRRVETRSGNGKVVVYSVACYTNIPALKRAYSRAPSVYNRPSDRDSSRYNGTDCDATADVTSANIDRVFVPNGKVSSENGVI